MITPYLKTAMVARVGNANRWRIPHGATHLSITILLPDTDPPSVSWVLPDGQKIDGNVIDADVPAGETLCLCDDFSRCGIDMTGCDDAALSVNVYETPISRGRLKMRGRCGFFRDRQRNMPKYVTASDGTSQRAMGADKLRVTGTADNPSEVIVTVQDLNKWITENGKKGTWNSIELVHVPYFTGDLAELRTSTQYFYRIPNPDFTSYSPTDRADAKVHEMPRLSIVHTGVHGHCDLSNILPGHFRFYGNPNMTPDDYDQIAIKLATSYQSMQNNGGLQLFILNPDDFVLEISSRRTSASDAAIATLQGLGMTIIEIEDE